MRNSYGVTLYCRPQKKRKDGRAPVEVAVSVRGEKVTFQLAEAYDPEEFARLRDGKRQNDVRKLCGKVTARLGELHERHPDASASTLKKYYLEGDPEEAFTKDVVTVRMLAEVYIEERVKGLPPEGKYRLVYGRFCDVYGSRPADSITGSEVRSFIQDLRYRDGFKDSTARNYWKKLRSLFEFAFQKSIIKVNPFVNVKMQFTDRDPVFLNGAELWRLKNLQNLPPYLQRTLDGWLFMAGSGLEYSDVLNLKPEDVKRNGTFLYIRKPRVKTGRVYTTILVDEAPRIWEKYGGQIKLPSNQDMNRWLKKLAKMAEIDRPLTTLTARHTMASMLVSGGYGKAVPIQVLQNALGHASLRQSLVYATLTEEALFDAYIGVQGAKN